MNTTQQIDPIDASSASTVFVRVLVEAVGRTGVNEEDFVRGAGISPAQANAPNGHVGLRAFSKLLEGALDLTHDEALGIHLAEQVHDSAFGLLAHVMMHAPTLRDMIGVISQFGALVVDRGALVLVETGNEALLRYDFVRCTPRADRMYAELCMLGLLRVVRQYAGQKTLPHQVYFQHARPAYHREYTRVFAGKECFEQELTGFVIARNLLDRRPIHLHAELYSVLRAEAEQMLERSSSNASHSERVLSYLLSRPPHALPDMNVAARDLGTSVRTLKRRLVEEGSSFRTLRQLAMANNAMQLLDDPGRTLQDVAHAMGFSEVTAFFRAFKRWKGTTPQEYRDALGARSVQNPTEDAMWRQA